MGERKLQILSRSKGEFCVLESGRYKENTSRGVEAEEEGKLHIRGSTTLFLLVKRGW
jgi:hypothetical protein